MNNINSTSTLPAVEWMHITPGLAEEWLGKNEGNRNKRARHIASLVRDLDGDRFLVTGDTIKFDWNGRLIDGQHRLSSIVAAKKSMTVLVVRGLDPRVQGVLDTNARRSGSDALYFDGVETYRTIIASVAKLEMSRRAGKLRTTSDTAVLQPTNSEIVEWHKENVDVEFAAQFAGKIAKQVKAAPSPLAYCILELSRIDHADCIEFFTSAVEYRTNGVGDPRLTMMKTFDRDASKGRSKLSNAGQISYIFRAWNAWREGRTIAKLPLSTGSGSVAIPEPK